VSVTVARANVLAVAPAIALDAFGPVPDVIDRARNGDRAAFAELYDTYVDSVYRYLLYRVREPSDAEDLCSEVFTRAFANIHRYRWQGKSFLAWLYTIARNAVTDRRRRERPTVEIDNAFGLAEDGPTAHERAVHGEAVDALRGAGAPSHDGAAGGPRPPVRREPLEPRGRQDAGQERGRDPGTAVPGARPPAQAPPG